MSKKEPSFDKICTIMQRNQRIAELERELMASKRAHDNTRELWAKDKRDLAGAVARERERCVKAIKDAREYCRDREHGKETMLDSMEAYAIARIQEAGRSDG